MGQKLTDLNLNYEKCEPSEIIDIKTKDNIPPDCIKYRSMKYYIPQKNSPIPNIRSTNGFGF